LLPAFVKHTASVACLHHNNHNQELTQHLREVFADSAWLQPLVWAGFPTAKVALPLAQRSASTGNSCVAFCSGCCHGVLQVTATPKQD
jgi:hypothetical protein